MTEPTDAARAKEDSVLKDHQIAALVNELRDIAVQYHGTQQLRERIAHVVVPVLRAAPSVLEDAARPNRYSINRYCHADMCLKSDAKHEHDCPKGRGGAARAAQKEGGQHG